jgi:hypothetical protein
MDRASDLRQDYDRLGELLLEATPATAAALARERRVIGELLEALEKPKEASVVDLLAAGRQAGSSHSRSSRGRRRSG